MAAVLACGPEAALSHRSAAALWDLRRTDRKDTDVTAPPRTRRPRASISLHHACLRTSDRAARRGIPVTSVPRTLLDLATVVSPSSLGWAIEAAERLRIFDLRAVDELVARARGHRGRRRLITALAMYREPPVTRSQLERLFLRECRDAGLPPPQMNVRIAGLEVDAVWPEQRLVVELDSTYHTTTAAFERDRIRDATLQLGGHRIVRITDRRLKHERDEVTNMLHALLGSVVPPTNSTDHHRCVRKLRVL